MPGLRRVEHVMGMPVVVDLRDEGGDRAVEDLFSWLRHVDAMFSTYKDDSAIRRLDRRELQLADAAVDWDEDDGFVVGRNRDGVVACVLLLNAPARLNEARKLVASTDLPVPAYTLA